MRSAGQKNSTYSYSICWGLLEKEMMQMEKEKEKEVCAAIAQLLREEFGIPEKMLGEENWEIRLTSGSIGLTALDLVYLFLEVEKRMKVHIASESLDDHGCDSILGIARAVYLANGKR